MAATLVAAAQSPAGARHPRRRGLAVRGHLAQSGASGGRPQPLPGRILWSEVQTARPLELAAAAGLYLAGLGFSAFFWVWLVRAVGEPLGNLPGVRGYYLSHLGKYAPGKGLSLVMRTAFAVEAGARPGAAALTAVYETLTTMAAGALVAAVLTVCLMSDDKTILWRVLALLVLAGLPILPGVFNFLVRRLSARLLRDGEQMMPRLPQRALPFGLLTTAGCWFFLRRQPGGGVAVALRRRSRLDRPRLAALDRVYRRGLCRRLLDAQSGGIGGAGVSVAAVPGANPRRRAVVAALLLRLLWTVTEFTWAALIWWLPARLTPDACST